MSKKEKRISINALENVAKENFQDVVTEQWFDIEVTIKRNLSMTEMMQFVQDVVNMCFTTAGTYIPEVMDFAIKSGILTYYANFTLPDNLEKQYWLTYATDAVDMVCKHINMVQLQEMVNGANRKIDHLCDADTIATKTKLTELSSAFAKMGEQFSDMFGGVSAEDVRRVVGAIGENGMDEEKIVSAYLQHMKSEAGDNNDK